MTAESPPLIVPVENQVRELDAKLLFAGVAAERGLPVVIGSRTFIHHRVHQLQRGVYVAKSMRSLSERMFGILRDLGFAIVGWDEEALLRGPDAHYYERRLSPGALRHVSALFAWGPDDARVLRDYPGNPGIPVHATGNPRADLMRPELRPFFAEDVAKIRARFGRIVLINTNFGQVNHFVPGLKTLEPRRGSVDPYTRGFIEYRTGVFEAFREMVPVLADALPDHTVLIRPHPVESHVPWIEIGSEHPNVRVSNEGNVIPWLLACEAVVQNGCTTAIEAALLDVPVVGYKPVSSERFDLPFCDAMAHTATSLEDLVDLLRGIASGDVGAHASPEKTDQIQAHLAALDGPLACERIVETLTAGDTAIGNPRLPGAARRLRGRLHAQLRTGVKRLHMRRTAHHNSAGYHDHRFPEISLAELRDRITRLGHPLGRFGQLRVDALSRHIFRVSR